MMYVTKQTKGTCMIFRSLSALTQLVVIRDYVSYNASCNGVHCTVIQAYDILSSDDVTCYDVTDGSILL